MEFVRTKNKRWIAVAVDQLTHPVVGMQVPPPKPADAKRHAVSPYVAWQSLLMAAAWSATEVQHRKHKLMLQRGQLLGARSYWARQWNWGEQAVRGFLATLEKSGMIRVITATSNQPATQPAINQRCNHLPSIISICNYDRYQHDMDGEQPASQPTINQLHNTETTTLNNNTNIQTSSSRERDQSEIAGLNGSTGYWVGKIAESFSQWAPDHESARRILVQMSEAYGAEALASAVIDFDAAVAARKAKPSASLLSRYCETARRRLKNSPEAKLSSATSAHAEALAVLERRRQRKLEGCNNG